MKKLLIIIGIVILIFIGVLLIIYLLPNENKTDMTLESNVLNKAISNNQVIETLKNNTSGIIYLKCNSIFYVFDYDLKNNNMDVNQYKKALVDEGYSPKTIIVVTKESDFVTENFTINGNSYTLIKGQVSYELSNFNKICAIPTGGSYECIVDFPGIRVYLDKNADIVYSC